MESNNSKRQQSSTPIHAGHGLVYHSNFTQTVSTHIGTPGHGAPAPPPQHSPVPVTSAASTASAPTESYPLYRDSNRDLQLVAANDAAVSGNATACSQVAASHSSSRRPSVSLSARRNKTSRNHPYTLRAASSSVSSVASNSSVQTHFSQTAPPTVQGSASSNISYPNLGILASVSTESHAASIEHTQATSTGAVQGRAWDNPDYFHSRSGSISSVSSDCSSSSLVSSGWSDTSNSRDTSRADFCYIPSSTQDTTSTSSQSFTPLSYHSSPATHFSDHTYGQPNAQRYEMHSSPATGLLAQNMGQGSILGTSIDQAAASDTGRDQRLIDLAKAISRAPGSANTTEKAKINFVHGWLKQSFILHPEGNISRHALYNAYVHVCHYYKLVPINTASYGKAVRSCWPGIKTRRLGVRGSSRYHYCGVRPADVNTRALIDYYSTFREDGKGVTCELFGREGHSGLSDGDEGIDEDSGAFSSNSGSSGQDGLVAHMDGLHGLGVSASSIQPTGSNSGLTSIPLVPPEVFNAKVERPGTSYSFNEEYQQRHNHDQPASYSGHPISTSEQSMDEAEEPLLSGPFASRQHRKQSSGASSLHDFMQNQAQQLQHQLTPELSFADVKTPTALQFKRKHYQPMITSQNYNSSDGINPSRLDVPKAGGSAIISQCSLSPLGWPSCSASISSAMHQGHHQTSYNAPTLGMTRSASIPSASSTADSFALSFKGRRATLPDLHITIPPLSQNPPSASGSVERAQTAGTIVEEAGEHIINGAAEESNDEDLLQAGKNTARRITESKDQSVQAPPMVDLPIPHFDDIIQTFSTKLVGSPNHPCSVKHTSPLSAGSAEFSSSNSADAVNRARNKSFELLRGLDIPNARAVWELYRTSHCRGLLRLAQQGKLEEFKGAFLLFWAQLDVTQQGLVQHPVLCDAMYQADAMLYPLLLTQLSDRLLSLSAHTSASSDVESQSGTARSVPVDLLQLLHISRHLEEWAVAAFDSYPKEFADCRIELASRAGHLIGRLAGVSQLAQALSRNLASSTAVDSMLAAWIQLDFETITNQCALVTGCPQDSIQFYLDAFHNLLQGAKERFLTRASAGLAGYNPCIGALLGYLDAALENYITSLAESSARLSGYKEDKRGAKAGDAFAAASLKMDERPFLIKWSYVSGQVLRDLIISSSTAFGSFQILALFAEEYLAFRILKNYTLRSDNVAASIQADNDTPVDAAQFAVPAYYVDSATGSSFADKAEAHISATLSAVSDAEAQGSKAFLVSPTSAVATGDQSDSSIVLQAGSDSFNLPFPQPSASVYTTSFDLSNTSMNWSPATRFLFGELSLPSATAVSFAGRSNMMSLNTPMRPNFENAGERPQTVNNNAISTASTTATNSSSSYPFVEGAETSLALLPPPTPSAFSSFPNLKSPGLSRYFPSAGGSSAYSI